MEVAIDGHLGLQGALVRGMRAVGQLVLPHAISGGPVQLEERAQNIHEIPAFNPPPNTLRILVFRGLFYLRLTDVPAEGTNRCDGHMMLVAALRQFSWRLGFLQGSFPSNWFTYARADVGSEHNKATLVSEPCFTT
eukprot:5051829-Pyramimonas_sp.AAC.1